MNPYLTQRANRRWWVYPLMALFFALSALLAVAHLQGG